MRLQNTHWPEKLPWEPGTAESIVMSVGSKNGKEGEGHKGKEEVKRDTTGAVLAGGGLEEEVEEERKKWGKEEEREKREVFSNNDNEYLQTIICMEN